MLILPVKYRLPLYTCGFTLLEILVVMVIIGILATMALISVGSREPSTSQEARRLVELLRLAAEEAVVRGQEWGLRLTNNGYEFMVLDDSLWHPPVDEILRPRQFPPELEPRLSMEGDELTVDSSQEDEDSFNDKKKAITPQILILSSGEISTFQLTLYAQGQPSWRVSGIYGGSFSAFALEQRR